MNTINFGDYKTKKREKIEEKIANMNIIKVNEDLFLYPEVAFKSNTKELNRYFDIELGMRVEELLDKYHIDSLNELVTSEGEKISLLINRNADNEIYESIEILNVSNKRVLLMKTPLDDDSKSREILVAIIAKAIREKDIEVTFFLQYNFKQIQEIIV